MNIHLLFRRSRIRLALWYAVVMGGILGLSGFGMYRSIVQSNWVALEREIESIAGTLHDSLEPMLPASGDPAVVLQQIFPDLCLVGQSCHVRPTLIQRHTTGISDRNLYYIRLFDRHGKLLAFSPNQPSPPPQSLTSTSWQIIQDKNSIRYRQFTTILHSAKGHIPGHDHGSWGYLQIGRTLASFDAENRRIKEILTLGFFIALGLVAASSWWLSALAMQPIYQSYQQQQQFTANAAHELRSPLASLLATVEAILRLGSSNQQDIPIMLQTVERQGRRLSQLIADLLLLTSLEQDMSAKPFKPCCLNDLVNDLAEEFLELATAANIQLNSQVCAEEIYVLGNESQLYRLVSNLIANAIQYTTAEGLVMVILTLRERTAIITVKDTGIGISMEQQSHIFERFYRVDSDRSRKTGGTGLGLAIAQAIAQKHQAHLKVESELGKGSIFTLEIAIAPTQT
ncbi:two-component system sensor histidine kinase RppB [Planktothricoides raciborskii]|uniref:histidine kinase n=1 Tax=Planktothricoides raciborskii GIHE-MW2 TaxID=2792601 RepID=A0AAU8JEB3_9CYAN